MPITPLPALSRSSPTFRAEVDQLFLTDLPNFSVEAEAARLQVVAAETATAEDALAAGLSQVAAAASELAAQGYAQTALNAPGTSATSTTSHDISNGAKTFAIQTGKLFVPGQRLTIARTSAPANVNYARVETYNPGTGALAVTVDSFAGVGAGITDWTIAVSGTPAQAGGVGSVSYTGLSATKALVATDAGAVYLTSTVPITVTMPAANTLGSTKLFILKNAGLFDMQVNDGAGNPLFILAANSAIIMWAVSTGSVAGTWTAIDGQGGFSGSATTINAVSAPSELGSAVIGTGKYIVTYLNASNYAAARVVSVSGSTISVGAEFVANATALNTLKIAPLTTDKAVIAYADTTDLRARVLSVSGTTITGGTEVTVNAANIDDELAICQAAANKALVMYRDTGATNAGNARVLSVSGTTITQGTEFTVNTPNTFAPYLCQLDTDKVLAVYVDSVAGATQGRVLSISTTTITAGTEATIYAANTNIAFATRLDTNKAYLGFLADDRIVTVSGTTITTGAAYQSSEDYYSSCVIPLSTTQVLSVGSFNNGVDNVTAAAIVDVSGTALTYQRSFLTESITATGGNVQQGEALSAGSGVAFYVAPGTSYPTAAIVYKGALV